VDSYANATIQAENTMDKVYRGIKSVKVSGIRGSRALVL